MANDREQFDANSFLADFDKEFSKDKTPEPTVPVAQENEETVEATPAAEAETPVEETQKEAVEQVEETEELEEKSPEEAEPQKTDDVVQEVNDPDLHKRNDAFKKLREEKEKLAESDRLLNELASQYGISKEELISKFKEDKFKKEAQKQGIPVEQYKRIQALESEVATIRDQYQREAFNYEADRLVTKYGLNEKQAEDLFLQIGAMGVDVIKNPKLLEPLYKAINYDTALQKGRQAQLEETKKRRETTASPSLGTKGTNVDSSDADIDAEIDAFLKEKIGR
jgi:subtilisin family serine protease